MPARPRRSTRGTSGWLRNRSGSHRWKRWGGSTTWSSTLTILGIGSIRAPSAARTVPDTVSGTVSRRPVRSPGGEAVGGRARPRARADAVAALRHAAPRPPGGRRGEGRAAARRRAGAELAAVDDRPRRASGGGHLPPEQPRQAERGDRPEGPPGPGPAAAHGPAVRRRGRELQDRCRRPPGPRLRRPAGRPPVGGVPLGVGLREPDRDAVPHV